MIRIKQVSVKLYIKRPLRKGVSYRHPQLSPQSLFSKKTDVLVHWLMSHAHRRLANSTSFREQQLTCRNRFEPGATLGCRNLWAVKLRRATKRAFFFFTAEPGILIPGPLAWGRCLCGPIIQEPRMTPRGTVRTFCFCGLIVHFHTTVGLCCELRRFSVWRGRVTGGPRTQLLRRDGPSRSVSRGPEVWGSAGPWQKGGTVVQQCGIYGGSVLVGLPLHKTPGREILDGKFVPGGPVNIDSVTFLSVPGLWLNAFSATIDV